MLISMNTITLHTASWLFNPGRPPIPGGALAVRDGRILETGTAEELTSRYGAVQRIDYPGCVLLPGFVNAHTHLELTHFPAWCLRGGLDYHPRTFADWLVQMVKVRRGVAPEEVLASLKAGIETSLWAGTTCVGDIITSPELLQAYQGAPGSNRLYLELIGQDTSLFSGRLQKALDALKTFDAPHHPGLSPHAPYTLNGAVLPAIAEAARRGEYPLSLHLAESTAEDTLLFDSTGPLADLLYPLVGWSGFLPPPRRTTPARFFDAAGLLGPQTLAVHCVHLPPADGVLLKERGVTICLCPRSNERLAVGTAPVHLFRKLDIPLCLGTDSLASNDSLSLWDEIRFALDIYRGELSPDDLLVMATSGGAAGLGLADAVGSLEPGKRADFQVVELDGACTAQRLLGHGKLQAVLVGGVER